MTAATLEEAINNSGGDAIRMLRNAQAGFYQFPVPDEWTNWRDEQRAWAETAVLFDQSYHMTDIYLRGPDAVRLLADTSINNYTDFPKLKAFQYVATNPGGYCIGDAIGIHLQDGSINIAGKPTVPAWLRYQAENGDYDVEIEEDLRKLDGGTARKVFRFQVQGPQALAILERLNGGALPETRFFGGCEFSINGTRVTGLRHGMAGMPGMEFWGPYAAKADILAALGEAGAEYGMKRGGARAYSTSGPQSGWVGALLPAIYTGEAMRGFREWLPANSYEATLSQGGSFASNDPDDYYMDPWDLGYHRLINWDHDFIGREALVARRDAPHRKKVWLRWDDDDAIRVNGSMLGDGPRHKFMEWPAALYSSCPLDRVEVGGTLIGRAVYAVYTVHVGGWFSIGIVDEDKVAFGEEATLIWGEPEVTAKPTVEPHEQVPVRVTMRRSALG